MLQNLSFTPLWHLVLTAVVRYFMAVKSPQSNAYNVSKTLPPVPSIKSLTTCDYITPVLKELHWLSVQARIEYKRLTLTFKCVHDKAPTYLSKLILRRVSSLPGFRFLDNVSLVVPKLFPGQTKAQQIVLFLCLPLNCGTSFVPK